MFVGLLGQREHVSVTLALAGDDRESSQLVEELLYGVTIPVPFLSQAHVRGRERQDMDLLALFVMHGYALADGLHEPYEGIIA